MVTLFVELRWLKIRGAPSFKSGWKASTQHRREKIVPRYFFHFVSADHVLKDNDGIELAGLSAAHGHALRLVHQMRVRLLEANNDWLIEISDETGKKPLVVLPSLRLRADRRRRGQVLGR